MERIEPRLFKDEPKKDKKSNVTTPEPKKHQTFHVKVSTKKRRSDTPNFFSVKVSAPSRKEALDKVGRKYGIFTTIHGVREVNEEKTKQEVTHKKADRFNLGDKGFALLQRQYGWRTEKNREATPSDPDGDGDVDSPLDQLFIKRRTRVQQIQKKIIDEKASLDPVGQEDTDIDNDGEHNTKTDKYLHNRRKVVNRMLDAAKKNRKG